MRYKVPAMFPTRDAWVNTPFKKQTNAAQHVEVAAHGIVILKIEGVAPPFNVFKSSDILLP